MVNYVRFAREVDNAKPDHASRRLTHCGHYVGETINPNKNVPRAILAIIDPAKDAAWPPRRPSVTKIDDDPSTVKLRDDHSSPLQREPIERDAKARLYSSEVHRA
jgi:hypothetical protein